jgi:hypothetical protein
MEVSNRAKLIRRKHFIQMQSSIIIDQAPTNLNQAVWRAEPCRKCLRMSRCACASSTELCNRLSPARRLMARPAAIWRHLCALISRGYRTRRSCSCLILGDLLIWAVSIEKIMCAQNFFFRHTLKADKKLRIRLIRFEWYGSGLCTAGLMAAELRNMACCNRVINSGGS